MRLINHIKLALYSGFIAGIFHGSVDIFFRLFTLGFEWFEIYQSLLVSSITFVILFLIISLFLEIFIKIFRLTRNKDYLSSFYFSTAIVMLFFFYTFMFINSTILLKIGFLSKISIVLNLIVIVSTLIIYILLMTKMRWLVGGIINLLDFFKIKKFVNSYTFMIVTFVIVSLVMDVFLISYMASTETNNNLEGYPNILLISMDTARADHLSTYGYSLETSPNIDNLGNKGIVFENAISSTSWSLPGHASMLTGKSLYNHGVNVIDQLLRLDEITLAEILRDNGYNTAGFSSSSHTKAKFGFKQGFNVYKDRHDFFETNGRTFDKTSLRTIVVSKVLPFIPPKSLNYYTQRGGSVFDLDHRKTSEEINDQVFRWLEINKENLPFFLFVHHTDPHEPYTLGNEFRSKFTDYEGDYFIDLKDIVDNSNVDDNVGKEIQDALVGLYDTEIYYMDRQIGALLDKLKEYNLDENILIIITADHGEELFEHGVIGHGHTLNKEAIHIPLVLYYSRGFDSKRIDKPVGVIDIVPTILDILDIDIPEDMDGLSLVPLMENSGRINRKFVLSELYGREHKEKTKLQKSITGDKWKLIEVEQWDYTDSEDIKIPSGLYDVKSDPNEQNNLYDTYPSVREYMQTQLGNMTG